MDGGGRVIECSKNSHSGQNDYLMRVLIFIRALPTPTEMDLGTTVNKLHQTKEQWI